MQHRTKVRLFWLFLGTLVTLSAVVPLAVVYVPDVYRNLMIRRLTSDDFDKREEALNFVIIELRKDEPHASVLPGVIGRLDVPNEENFLQIVQALDVAGRWSRPPIPDEAWLRWLGTIIDDPTPEARQLACRFLARLPDLANDTRVIDTLEQLLSDTDQGVRYQALLAAAELFGAASDPLPYDRMIAAATEDESDRVARQAWLLLGLIDPVSGVAARWSERSPQVAQAILWAALRTNPDLPTPAIEALNDSETDPRVRAMAAYALSYSPKAEARDAMVAVIARETADPGSDPQRLVWRTILGVPIDKTDANDPAANALVGFRGKGQFRGLNDPLYLSAVHRFGPVVPVLELKRQDALDELDPDAPDLIDHPDVLRWSQQNMVALAKFEGLPPGRQPIPLSPAMQPAVQLAALAVTAELDPQALVPFLKARVSTVRDRACIIAMQRLTTEQQTELAETLLKDFSDEAKMSGAMIAGLTNVRPTGHLGSPFAPPSAGDPIDLLTYWAEHGSTWTIQQMMRIALWMQGRPPPEAGDMERTIPGMLVHEDIPWTSVLLALAHRRHPEAMRFLLATRDELSDDPLDLIVDPLELFDEHRWWLVLRTQLADDAPQFWPWADPDLLNFQVEVLRSWYLLHRNRPDTLYRERDKANSMSHHGRSNGRNRSVTAGSSPPNSFSRFADRL